MAQIELRINAESSADLVTTIRALGMALGSNTGETILAAAATAADERSAPVADDAPKAAARATRSRAAAQTEAPKEDPKATETVVAKDEPKAAAADPFAAPEAPKEQPKAAAPVAGADLEAAKNVLKDLMSKKGPLAAQALMKQHFNTGKISEVPAERLGEFIELVQKALQ